MTVIEYIYGFVTTLMVFCACVVSGFLFDEAVAPNKGRPIIIGMMIMTGVGFFLAKSVEIFNWIERLW